MQSRSQVLAGQSRDLHHRSPKAVTEGANTQAKDVRATDLVWTEPDKAVREFDLLLTKKRISTGPVVDDGEIVGIVGEGARAPCHIAIENIPNVIEVKDKWIILQLC